MGIWNGTNTFSIFLVKWKMVKTKMYGGASGRVKEQQKRAIVGCHFGSYRVKGSQFLVGVRS